MVFVRRAGWVVLCCLAVGVSARAASATAVPALAACLAKAKPIYEGPRAGEPWAKAKTPNIQFVDQGQTLAINNTAARRTLAFHYIPVRPGRRYVVGYEMITEGVTVTEAERGATIFLEWADAKHNFVRGGDYRGEKESPADWRAYARLSPPVPEDARFLKFYFALESHGKARFRRLRVVEYDDYQPLAVTAPVPDAEVDTLLPTFAWEDVKRPCRVVLAADAALAKDRFIVDAATGATEVTLDRELPAGSVWHYQIVDTPMYTDDAHRSEVRTFRVAADAGVWPPVVTMDYAYSTEPRPTVRAAIRAPGDAVLTARIDGEPAEVAAFADGVAEIRPSRDLANAPHKIEFLLERRGEQRRVVRFFTTAHPGHRVTFRQGISYIDGDPFFPIGTLEPLRADRDDIAGLKDAGFNLVHSYAYTAIKAITPEEIAAHGERAQNYLRLAEAEGVKVLMGLPRNITRAGDMEATFDYMKPLAGGDFPALFYYYLYDEPILAKVPEATMAALHRTVREIDPFHPGYVIYADAVISLTPSTRDYVRHADAIGSDPYPRWRGHKKDYRLVKSWTENCRKLAGPDRPVWTALEAFDPDYLWGTGPLYGQAGQHGPIIHPTYEEFRCQAFLALAGGADGIIHYPLPHRAYDLPKHAPDSWAGMVKVNHELQRLAPFATTPGLNNPLAIELPDPFVAWSRDDAQGRTVVALINPTDAEHRLRVRLPVAGRKVALLFEGEPADAAVDAAFGPFEVKVYQVEAP